MTAYLKAYAALVGSICTALLGIYGPDSEVGKWLTIGVAIATAVATWVVPNLDPKGERQDESVQPPAALNAEVDDNPGDDPRPVTKPFHEPS